MSAESIIMDPPKREPLKIPFSDLIAGSVGGAAQVIVGQPLDTIKVRAQIAPKGMFSGPLDIAAKTIQKEGFFALYKGMLSPLLGISLVNSLLFTSYALSKRVVSPYPVLSIPETAVAGAMAGAAQSVLASPVEMFKIRMQGQYGSKGDKTLGTVAREMWREWGLKAGVMRGFWITVLREIPAYAGFYSAFEASKRAFKRSMYPHPEQNLPVWALLASGASGGTAYWLACYPLDVVKSKVQMASSPPKGLGYIARELSDIWHNDRGALVRGISPTLVRAVPAAASTFVAFELTKGWIEGERM